MNYNIYAFIDAQNLYMGVQKMGWRLNYKRFQIFLKQKFHVSKTYLFVGYLSSNEKLYEAWRSFRYTLIFKPIIQVSKSKHKQIKGNVDAELVLHAMIEFDHFDQALIVSSDGDFHCLIDYLHSKNKLKGIITTHKKYSSLLRKFSNFILPIELIRKKVEKI